MVESDGGVPNTCSREGNAPLLGEEAQDILTVVKDRRNGTRWPVALALGLRQPESLGLRWIRVFWQIKRLRYRHGCEDPHACAARLHRYPRPKDCPKAKRTSGRRHVCLTACRKNCTKHGGAWRYTHIRETSAIEAAGRMGRLTATDRS